MPDAGSGLPEHVGARVEDRARCPADRVGSAGSSWPSAAPAPDPHRRDQLVELPRPGRSRRRRRTRSPTACRWVRDKPERRPHLVGAVWQVPLPATHRPPPPRDQLHRALKVPISGEATVVNQNAVTTPSVPPPPPRQAQNSSGSVDGVGRADLAVGRDDLDLCDGVAGQAVRPVAETEAAAQSQPGDTDGRARPRRDDPVPRARPL